jgi:cell division protein ZapE
MPDWVVSRPFPGAQYGAENSQSGQMQPTSPLARYRADLQRPDFIADRVQHKGVRLTNRLFHRLLHYDRTAPRGFWSRWLRRGAQRKPPRGLYFWGGVGRGKTYVVDLFYEALPFPDKLRLHFHRFMRDVHRELRDIGQVEAPLELLAENLSKRARVLCLDEFHVSDITDAMLLGGLLAALTARGVVLVTTSNEAPRKLYWDGLQRERFLPAIDHIERHMVVYCFDGDTDYRLRALERAEIYHSPLDAGAGQALSYAFEHVSPEFGIMGQPLEIEGRPITTVRSADGVVWFEFANICLGPRSSNDYIEIGRMFQTVLVANIPVLDDAQLDAARRFIHLVDELYDRNVKLIVSAAVAPHDLYVGTKLTGQFKRTASRLEEMRTHAYLAKPHISD